MNGNNRQAQINININQCDVLTCPNCESDIMYPLFTHRTVSPIVSPTGKEEVLTIPCGMRCANCQSIYTDTSELIRKTPEEWAKLVAMKADDYAAPKQ